MEASTLFLSVFTSRIPRIALTVKGKVKEKVADFLQPVQLNGGWEAAWQGGLWWKKVILCFQRCRVEDAFRFLILFIEQCSKPSTVTDLI